MRAFGLLTAAIFHVALPAGQIVVSTAPVPAWPKGTDSAHHYFSGQEVELALHIEGGGRGPADIRAHLYQLTTKMSVPYGDPLEVPADAYLDDTHPATASLVLTLPSVARETSFDLVFMARAADSAEWQMAGRAALRIYPADMLEPLRAWSTTTQLRLVDKTGVLSAFLTARDIAFVDGRVVRPPPAGAGVVTIVVGDESQIDRLPSSVYTSGSIVLLRESVETLPKVTIRPRAAGRLIDVEMEIIEALDNDPRAQKVFLEILQQSQPTIVH